MDEANYDIDYKSMFENLKKFVQNHFEVENEFFSLTRELGELQPYSNEFSENMFKMKMVDQVKVMRIAVELGKLQKELCEKYGFDSDVEVTEYD